jgi:FtsH-binding integral membrane protein
MLVLFLFVPACRQRQVYNLMSFSFVQTKKQLWSSSLCHLPTVRQAHFYGIPLFSFNCATWIAAKIRNEEENFRKKKLTEINVIKLRVYALLRALWIAPCFSTGAKNIN